MSERQPPAWRVAVSLFTTIPAGVNGVLDDEVAARAILWLPAIGLLAGGAGAGVLLAAGRFNATGPGRLLGAALALAVIGILTGGLHLDGLADTADGLGSRRLPPRRSTSCAAPTSARWASARSSSCCSSRSARSPRCRGRR